jgi:hypothetical protein
MDDFTDEIARVQKAQARIAAASAAREKLQAARYEWARLHFSRGAVFFGKPEEFDALIDAEMKTTSGVTTPLGQGNSHHTPMESKDPK